MPPFIRMVVSKRHLAGAKGTCDKPIGYAAAVTNRGALSIYLSIYAAGTVLRRNSQFNDFVLTETTRNETIITLLIHC